MNTETKEQTFCGGIDLGGTKIEARLFNKTNMETIDVKRIATPHESYEALLHGLIEQTQWLMDCAQTSSLLIGVAVPGIVSPTDGSVFTANTRAKNHTIGKDLQNHFGREFSVVNDCMAFALSEANGGAGQGAKTVMGLILGTGAAGGYCIDGKFPPRHNGLAIEIGHVGIPAIAIARHDLPIWDCGCGRKGCMETYISGTGLSNIAEYKTGKRSSAEALVASSDKTSLNIWADITGECLSTIQLMLDPDCVVLGGGLSNMPGITERLTDSMKRHKLADVSLPSIKVAQHGDSSGARGAALLAGIT